jgi:hypothetical protein
MRSPETGGGGRKSQGGEDRIGRSPRQAQQTELSINDRFKERFLTLFGDSPESRDATSTLLWWTNELSQHGKAFSLLILSEPSQLDRRYTLLRFGSLVDRCDRLEVQVGKWGTEGLQGRLDTHLIFPADYFDRVAVTDGTVVFTGSRSTMELDVFKYGRINIQPKNLGLLKVSCGFSDFI